MADLGARIINALRLITTDPALVSKVEASTTSDAAQQALLDTLGTTTTTMATQIADIQAAIAALPPGPTVAALTQKVDALQVTIDSVNTAFPDTPPAPTV